MTDTPTMTIYERLSLVQEQLKAPKSKKATAGAARYSYRSCEDILEAAKPILKANGLVLVISDQVIQMESRHDLRPIEVKSYDKVFTEVHGGDRFYVEATATVFDFRGGSVTSTASARETQVKRGMDDSQITGSASSYARKYALSGLFGIDDTKDADTDEYRGHDEGERIVDSPVARPTRIGPAAQAQLTRNAPDHVLYRFNEDDRQTLLDTIAAATTDEDWGDIVKYILSNSDGSKREAGLCLLMEQAPTLAILQRINTYIRSVNHRTLHTDVAFNKREKYLIEKQAEVSVAQ